jgi:hypothetical protein
MLRQLLLLVEGSNFLYNSAPCKFDSRLPNKTGAVLSKTLRRLDGVCFSGF